MTGGPIIVFGAPRSGTTFLNAILNEQPGVFITHETRLFAWLNFALKATRDHPNLVLGHGEQFHEFIRPVMANAIRDFYRSLRPKAEYWGDKNPHYASSENDGALDLVAEEFPHSRFIHIIRDGRDVVSSLVRKTDPEGNPWVNFEGAHRVWISHVKNGMEFGRRWPDRYFELRYEDLVRDSLKNARRMFEFLDIEMADRIAEYCEKQESERTPLSQPTRSLDDPLKSDWSSIFDVEQQGRSMEMLEELLLDLGYIEAD